MEDYIDLPDCGQCSPVDEDAEIRLCDSDEGKFRPIVSDDEDDFIPWDESSKPEGEPETKADAEDKTEPPQPEPDPDELAEAEATVEILRAKGYEATLKIVDYSPYRLMCSDGKERMAEAWALVSPAPGRYAFYADPESTDAFEKKVDRIAEEARGLVYEKAGNKYGELECKRQ